MTEPESVVDFLERAWPAERWCRDYLRVDMPNGEPCFCINGAIIEAAGIPIPEEMSVPRFARRLPAGAVPRRLAPMRSQEEARQQRDRIGMRFPELLPFLHHERFWLSLLQANNRSGRDAAIRVLRGYLTGGRRVPRPLVDVWRYGFIEGPRGGKLVKLEASCGEVVIRRRSGRYPGFPLMIRCRCGTAA